MDGSHDSRHREYDDVSSGDDDDYDDFDRSAPILGPAKSPIKSNPYIRYKVKLCSHYASGRCKNARCNYAHGEDELAYYNKKRKDPGLGKPKQQYLTSIKQKHYDSEYKVKLCVPFMDGKDCPRDNCGYAHGPHELAPAIRAIYKTKACPEWANGLTCPRRKCCLRAHGLKELKSVNENNELFDYKKKFKKPCASLANKTKCCDRDCKYSHSEISLVTCPYLEKGEECLRLQRYGKCPFFHDDKTAYYKSFDNKYSDPFLNYKIRLCVEFSKSGSCKNGESESCSYAHGVDDLRGFGKSNYKRTLCHHWEQGLICPRGEEKCSFAHGPEQLILDDKGKMCPFLKEGRKCQQGDKCSFDHFESPLTVFEKGKRGAGEEGKPGKEGMVWKKEKEGKKELCPDLKEWLNCQRGEECPFAHFDSPFTSAGDNRKRAKEGGKEDFYDGYNNNNGVDDDVPPHSVNNEKQPRKKTSQTFDLKLKQCPKEKADLTCHRFAKGECPYAHHHECIASSSALSASGKVSNDGPSSDKSAKSYCAICDVAPGPINMPVHLKGKKHMTNVANIAESDKVIPLMAFASASAVSSNENEFEPKRQRKTHSSGKNDNRNDQLFEYRSEKSSHQAPSKSYVGPVDRTRRRNRFPSPGRSGEETHTRSRSRDRGSGRRHSRSRSRSRCRSFSSARSRSRESPSRTVLRKTGKGDWRVRDAQEEEEDDDSQPLIFECLTEKEKVDLEKAHSLVEFAQSCLDSNDGGGGGGGGKGLTSSLKSNPFMKAYDESMKALKKLRKEIRVKQRKLPRNVVKNALESQLQQKHQQQHHMELQQAYNPEFPTDGEVSSSLGLTNTSSSSATEIIDYLEATTPDMTPLNVSQVEAYFSRFGSLMWCLQAGSNFTVIFKYHDVSLYKMALEFNHLINGKTLRLQGLKNGGVPIDFEAATSAASASAVAAAPAPVSASAILSPAKSTTKEDSAIDADYLASLTPEQFARYVNSIR